MDMTDLGPAELAAALAGLLFLLAASAAWAERRRAKRRDLDRPGVMPWHLIQVIALILGVAAAALALKL
ncbi:MAG: hypothetical protein JOZ90_09110 [Alphaproteobacteria bacterium]|nr:hypothetical protein [Alphaproteobacteria bacterium]MBV9373279.1 hypothetical protein [Alphaproteobacteria bacterium]MBV9901242.1 hypothetical protein [Alphaproteobacteria bacterium]